MGQRRYYDLIASLPGLPVHFAVARLPISEVRLNERLQMLDWEDAAVVRQWFQCVHWDRQALERTDSDVAGRYQRLVAQISNPTLRDLIEWRLDMRTIIAALRRRLSGMGPPSGVGQWVEKIRRHYQHPTFQLQGRYPWIGRFDQLLRDGRALEAQRLIFEVNYREFDQWNPPDMFSFEALLVYLAKWEIIDRWTSLDEAAGRDRFDTILKETLGEYARLFESDRPVGVE